MFKELSTKLKYLLNYGLPRCQGNSTSQVVKIILFLFSLFYLTNIRSISYAQTATCSDYSNYSISESIGTHADGSTLIIKENSETLTFSLKANPAWKGHWVGIYFVYGDALGNDRPGSYLGVIQISNDGSIGPINLNKNDYPKDFGGEILGRPVTHRIRIIYLAQQLPEDLNSIKSITPNCTYQYIFEKKGYVETPVNDLYGDCNMSAEPPNPQVGKSLVIHVEGIPKEERIYDETITYSDLMLFNPLPNGSLPSTFDPNDETLVIGRLKEGINDINIPGTKFTREGIYAVYIRHTKRTGIGGVVELVTKHRCSLILDTKEQVVITPAPGEVITTPPVPGIEEICNPVNDVNKKEECKDCVKKGSVWTAFGCIQTDVSGFVSSFFTIGLGLAGGIAFLFLIYGGFLVLTSAGNPETIQQGKQIITSAIAGLLLIIFSVLLLQLIAVDILKIPGFS